MGFFGLDHKVASGTTGPTGQWAIKRLGQPIVNLGQ